MSKEKITRREVIKMGLGSAAAVFATSLSACQPPAPTAAPLAPTTESALPKPSATPVPPQPTATSVPAPSAAAAPRTLRVAGLESANVLPTNPDWNSGIFDVYETLTYRDDKTGELLPRLAESWEQIEPTVWRFKLRKGVKFTNGEDFSAAAVHTAVTEIIKPDAIARTYMGDLAEARVVDDYTVDIISQSADPILPHRLTFLFIAAPDWLRNSATETVASTAVGTGPLKLVEWSKGQYYLLQANDGYWGAQKARVPEVKILVRKESGVRASMIAAGEADFVSQLGYPDVKTVTKAVSALTVRVQGIRINTKNPVLQDLRVRQALAMAIDLDAIAETIYAGKVTPPNGQMVNKTAVGWNPDLKPYAYDPDGARQLLKEAGAEGAAFTLISQQGYGIMGGELVEALVGFWQEIGLNVDLQMVEASKRSEYLAAGKPGAPQSDLLHVQHGNDLMDSELTFNSYYLSTGGNSQFSDARLDELINKARPLGGDERSKAFQAAWAYAYDQYPWIPVNVPEYIFGLGEGVDWAPRVDGIVYYSQIGFAS